MKVARKLLRPSGHQVGSREKLNHLQQLTKSGAGENEEEGEEEPNRREKGKGRADDNGETDEEEESGEDDGEAGGATAVINTLDTLCNESIIGICRINVLDPPAQMVFGTWNRRELREKEAKKLAKEMTVTKFSPFASSNILPLVISGDCLDPSCRQTNPNVELAPMLELTEAAKEAGTKLLFAGGHHRRRATEILYENSKEMVGKLEEKISEMKAAMKKGARQGTEEKIQDLEQMLKEEQILKEKLGIWGVIAYEAGK
jgi:hypothetical protein